MWQKPVPACRTVNRMASRSQSRSTASNCWVLPEEEKYLTPEVLDATCLIGTRGQLIERLGALSEEGLDQVMMLPNFDTRYDVLQQVAGLIGELG